MSSAGKHDLSIFNMSWTLSFIMLVEIHFEIKGFESPWHHELEWGGWVLADQHEASRVWCMATGRSGDWCPGWTALASYPVPFLPVITKFLQVLCFRYSVTFEGIFSHQSLHSSCLHCKTCIQYTSMYANCSLFEVCCTQEVQMQSLLLSVMYVCSHQCYNATKIIEK